jgi:hypothetical protein
VNELNELLPELTNEEIKEFVKDYRNGRYLALDTPEKIQFGAGVILMAMKPKPTKKEIDNIGMIVGFMDQRVGNRVCNGIPMFGKIRFINKEDWKKITKYYEKTEEAIKKVEV